MNRKRNFLVVVVAIGLATVLVFAIYSLQVRHLNHQLRKSVVVARNFIPVGTTITEPMLTMKQVNREDFVPTMISRLADIVGTQAVVPLGADEPLLDWKLDRTGLFPTANQATFQVPREYILSMSSDVRAGDRVFIFLSGEEVGSQKLFEQPIVVAAVKTATNTEVDNSKTSNLLQLADGNRQQLYVARRDANGTINQLNLNMTEEQWIQLDTLCKSGRNKIVVANTPLSYGLGRSVNDE